MDAKATVCAAQEYRSTAEPRLLVPPTPFPSPKSGCGILLPFRGAKPRPPWTEVEAQDPRGLGPSPDVQLKEGQALQSSGVTALRVCYTPGTQTARSSIKRKRPYKQIDRQGKISERDTKPCQCSNYFCSRGVSRRPILNLPSSPFQALATRLWTYCRGPGAF